MHKYKLFFLIQLICWTAICANQKNTSEIPKGTYLAYSGRGFLSFTPYKNRTVYIIKTYGSNGHSCFAEGTIDKQKDELRGKVNHSEKCYLNMKQSKTEITVSYSNAEDCFGFCGARATLEQTFYIPNELCLNSSKEKVKKSFYRLYKERKFTEAKNVLLPLVQTCENFLGLFEDIDLRNDLAVTYKNLGAKKECLQILEKYKEQSEYTESEIKENFPPVEAEEMIPRVKKLKFNLEKCAHLNK